MESTIFNLESFDGYKLDIKLSVPCENEIERIVVFVQGTGPNTYDNPRKVGEVEFNYFDLYEMEFTKRNIAFCRWSTRGCYINSIPPTYVEINENEYGTYLPSTSVKDVETVVNYLQKRFKSAKIILLGFSEGTEIAAIVANNKNVEIGGLLLAGYSNEDLKSTLEWQLSGESDMVNMCKWFDYDKKGYITQDDYNEDRYNVRKSYLNNARFEDYDVNGDGIINSEDFKMILLEYKESLFSAIESNDDTWLKNNYPVRITSKYCKEYFDMNPIKEIITKINIPIYIFHGADDANLPIKGALDIKKEFEELGKSNLKVEIFENHDHNLNYMLYPINGSISEGLQSIFESAMTI